jgi:nucleotide-binding universal stress UspA family protein
MQKRTAYLPLVSYPETAPDDAVLATVDLASLLGCDLHVTTFAVNIPNLRSPLGGLLLDVPALVRAAEEKSKAECERLGVLVKDAAGAKTKLELTTREIVLGAALEISSTEARSFGLSVVPWSGETWTIHDVAEAVVFGSGRPTILVPAMVRPPKFSHVAIAWDGSRVAARALWDALALQPQSCEITVLTIRDEKPLSSSDLASTLASSLKKQGYVAKSLELALGERTVAAALQESALEAGAQLLAMGGFGHSRIRDFVLGGATKGVFADLRLPVLLSH